MLNLLQEKFPGANDFGSEVIPGETSLGLRLITALDETEDLAYQAAGLFDGVASGYSGAGSELRFGSHECSTPDYESSSGQSQIFWALQDSQLGCNTSLTSMGFTGLVVLGAFVLCSHGLPQFQDFTVLNQFHGMV
ncbi:hypothetical protein Vadar_024863 [Vaccinium darrowii]|uniref:Uncharacterized protein n=1 Tax=Vaccinium darrowii TaxID=229202 RepID=A0ACB7YA07_9ERIC|nr:hypothetical protein Vadar_024863 [Vaccinium darrowii]